jgi:catabolite repression HPr-like protein
MISKSMTVEMPNGLDARPVAELVQMASRYVSTIHIESGTIKVNAKSIMGMMTLDLDNGQAVTVEADGKDEDDALDGIEGFLKGTRTTD